MKEALDLACKIIDAASCGILVYEATGQCIQANPAAAEIAGAKVADLLAQNFRELPSWREAGLIARADAVLATGEKQSVEFFGISSFGRKLWLSCQLSSFNKNDRPYLLLVTKDVTGRHEAEEKVRQLSHAVEQSPASIVITDRAGNIEYVNPRFCQKTGYDLDEVRGKNPRILKSGEMPATGYQELWKAISSGGEWRGEFHNRKKNGELFWEHAAISPILDARGKISHYLAVKEDITEQKLTIEALRLSENRYRTLFNGMTEGFALHELVYDAAGQPCDYRFKEINPAFERITGLKSEQVLERRFSEVLPGEDPRWLAVYAQVAQTGEAIHFEHYSIVLRRHFEAYAYRTAPGQFAVMFQDSTERKQAEMQLRDQARLLDLASDAIIVRDLEDHIQYWNKSAEQIYGWSAAEALGQNIAELLQKDSSGYAAARKTLLERGDWSGEFVARNRKGTEVVVEARWTLMRDHQGLPHAVLAINTDITQRKRIEEQLLRT
ncbi:MAG TPA: PAS domain S-box protein, partial [Dongiaceae bacterium]|nr:PAS domain S-box protein [Dongiaceae bacterium]